MRYQVLWRIAAENELADIWINATDRNAVAQAADALEARLKTDPLEEGESRSGPDRIAFQPPLAVVFSVSPQDLLVTVLQCGGFVCRQGDNVSNAMRNRPH